MLEQRAVFRLPCRGRVERDKSSVSLKALYIFLKAHRNVAPRASVPACFGVVVVLDSSENVREKHDYSLILLIDNIHRSTYTSYKVLFPLEAVTSADPLCVLRTVDTVEPTVTDISCISVDAAYMLPRCSRPFFHVITSCVFPFPNDSTGFHVLVHRDPLRQDIPAEV